MNLNEEQREKVKRIQSLLTNSLIPGICLLVKAKLLNNNTAKSILNISEVEKLNKELKNELK